MKIESEKLNVEGRSIFVCYRALIASKFMSAELEFLFDYFVNNNALSLYV